MMRESGNNIDRANETTVVKLHNNRSWHWMGSTITAFFAISLGFVAFAEYRYGGIRVFVRSIRGETVILDPSRFNLGSITVGETIVRQSFLHNYTSEPIRILGANSQCSCVVAEDLPAIVPPGESYTINVRIKPEAKRKIEETIVLFTDHPAKQKLSIGVSGLTNE